MKVDISEVYPRLGESRKIRIQVKPDAADIEYNKKIRGKLNHQDVYINIINGSRLDRIHPDLLGLTVLLLIAPMSKRRIELNIPVSDGFKQSTARSGLIHVDSPTDASLARREVPVKPRPGLAFSGGVDSCAALLLMPIQTVPVFLHRQPPPNSGLSNYSDSAALLSCEKVLEAGYDLQCIGTSLEYIRKPVGNPVDWSNSAPAVVNADGLALDSISFGMIAESAYWTGGDYFSDLKTRGRYAAWAPVFDYCHIPISLPTASLSEVITQKICLIAGQHLAPQSCIRGSAMKPCGHCFKCFRKGLVESALRKTKQDTAVWHALTRGSEVAKKVLEVPIHHEIVIAWALNNCQCAESEVFRRLLEKLGPVCGYGHSLSFLEKYYPDGIEYTAPSMRDGVEKNIRSYCAPMSTEDKKFFEQWQAKPLNDSPTYQQGQKNLLDLLG